MFGIIHGLFSLFAIGANDVKKTAEEERNKEDARTSGGYTYRDKKGELRLLKNGHRARRVKQRGYDCIYDSVTGEKVVDYLQDKIDNNKKELLREGKTAYRKSELDLDPNTKNVYRERYGGWNNVVFDISTDKEMLSIYINGYEFYMEVDSGYLLRLTDDFKERSRSNIFDWRTVDKTLEVNDIIRLFNERQDRLKACRLYMPRGDWDTQIQWERNKTQKEIDKSNEWMKVVFYCLGSDLSYSVSRLNMDANGNIRFRENYYRTDDGKQYLRVAGYGYDPNTGMLI